MILYTSKTEFNDIVVTRKGKVITLWSPSDIKQSAVNIETPYLPNLEYARNTLSALAFFPNPSAVLVLGLGGGTIPLMYQKACKNAHIDVVEIDTEMLAVARRFFKFRQTGRISVIHDDAGSYCGVTRKRYDIIIMDAYIGERQPDPLTSAGFYRNIERILSEEGVLANNLMKGRGHNFEEKCRKIKSIFSHVHQLPGETRDNVIVFASHNAVSKFKYIMNAAEIERTLPFPFDMTRLAGRITPMP